MKKSKGGYKKQRRLTRMSNRIQEELEGGHFIATLKCPPYAIEGSKTLTVDLNVAPQGDDNEKQTPVLQYTNSRIKAFLQLTYALQAKGDQVDGKINDHWRFVTTGNPGEYKLADDMTQMVVMAYGPVESLGERLKPVMLVLKSENPDMRFRFIPIRMTTTFYEGCPINIDLV